MNLKFIILSGAAMFGALVSLVNVYFVDSPAEGKVSISVETSTEEKSVFACSNISDSFAQDESNILAAEYSNDGAAECLFVGCGGVI